MARHIGQLLNRSVGNLLKKAAAIPIRQDYGLRLTTVRCFGDDKDRKPGNYEEDTVASTLYQQKNLIVIDQHINDREAQEAIVQLLGLAYPSLYNPPPPPAPHPQMPLGPLGGQLGLVAQPSVRHGHTLAQAQQSSSQRTSFYSFPSGSSPFSSTSAVKAPDGDESKSPTSSGTSTGSESSSSPKERSHASDSRSASSVTPLAGSAGSRGTPPDSSSSSSSSLDIDDGTPSSAQPSAVSTPFERPVSEADRPTRVSAPNPFGLTSSFDLPHLSGTPGNDGSALPQMLPRPQGASYMLESDSDLDLDLNEPVRPERPSAPARPVPQMSDAASSFVGQFGPIAPPSVAPQPSTSTGAPGTSQAALAQPQLPLIDIYIYINSDSGSPGAVLALVDVIEALRSKCRIHTLCKGVSYGLASLVLAAGTPGHRSADHSSRIMVGEGIHASGHPVNRPIYTSANRKADEIRRLYSRYSINLLTPLIQRDPTLGPVYFNAVGAQAMGIIDNVTA